MWERLWPRWLTITSHDMQKIAAKAAPTTFTFVALAAMANHHKP